MKIKRDVEVKMDYIDGDYYSDDIIVRFTHDLNNGQTLCLEFYDYSTRDESVYEVGLIVYDNNKFDEEYEDYIYWYEDKDVPSTGKNPFAAAAVIYPMYIKCIEKLREINKGVEVVVRAGWMDEKRKRVYGKFLKKLGYRYGETDEGKECWEKRYEALKEE